MRWWAFWRRLEYLTGTVLFIVLVSTGLYYLYGVEDPTCFDNQQNGIETGVDCGGSCLRICEAEIVPLKVLWVETFKIVDGQYNAVAYIQNLNKNVGSPHLEYILRLHDERGLIEERRGETTIPVNGVYPLFEGKIITGDRIPTDATVEFVGDTVWLPGSEGKERFTLTKRQLTGVDTDEPRLIAEIRNDGLFESQDLEIVATIFDSRKNPLTASKTTVKYFAGESSQNVVFTWREPIATTLRSCEVPTDVLLAIDLSGSMNDDGGTPPEPISSVLNAAESFVSRLKPDDQSGLVTYATEAEVVSELTNNNTSVARAVSDLSIAPKEEVGSTNTGDALKLMREELTSLRHSENARKVAILLTDGLANAGGEDPEAYALQEAEQLKDKDVMVFAIGLGERVNKSFLQSIASSNEHYYFAPSINQLESIYSQITAAICEDGAAVIEVIPKIESSFPAFPGT